MSVLVEIRKDALRARKAKSAEASVLVTLLGEIDTKSKTMGPGKEMDDADIVAIVRKFLKGIDETLKLLDPKVALDAVAQANAERVALEAYLPKQMSDEELKSFISAKAEQGAGIGQIMSALKSEKAGQYDGRMASQLAKEVLA